MTTSDTLSRTGFQLATQIRLLESTFAVVPHPAPHKIPEAEQIIADLNRQLNALITSYQRNHPSANVDLHREHIFLQADGFLLRVGYHGPHHKPAFIVRARDLWRRMKGSTTREDLFVQFLLGELNAADQKAFAASIGMSI